jgi:hypothetical protein
MPPHASPATPHFSSFPSFSASPLPTPPLPVCSNLPVHRLPPPAVRLAAAAAATVMVLVRARQITGFQGGGGVTMLASIKGPDTDGRTVPLRSVDSEKPAGDAAAGGWLAQLFRVPAGSEVTPAVFPPDAMLGQAPMVPFLNFNRCPPPPPPQ